MEDMNIEQETGVTEETEVAVESEVPVASPLPQTPEPGLMESVQPVHKKLLLIDYNKLSYMVGRAALFGLAAGLFLARSSFGHFFDPRWYWERMNELYCGVKDKVYRPGSVQPVFNISEGV